MGTELWPSSPHGNGFVALQKPFPSAQAKPVSLTPAALCCFTAAENLVLIRPDVNSQRLGKSWLSGNRLFF